MSDERLGRIEDKVDRVVNDIGHIKETTAANLESLKAHMRRTAILEEIVLPISKEREQVKGVLKFIGLVALLGGIVESVILLLSFIKGIHV